MATCRLVSDERQHLDNVGGYPVQIELETLQKAQAHASFGWKPRFRIESTSWRTATGCPASDENYGFRYPEGPLASLG